MFHLVLILFSYISGIDQLRLELNLAILRSLAQEFGFAADLT
jgi:hypothetical protein